MILFYDEGCPLCRLLSWIAALRPGLKRLPLSSEEGKRYLMGFDYTENQPYILDGDLLYSGRKMVLRWLGVKVK